MDVHEINNDKNKNGDLGTGDRWQHHCGVSVEKFWRARWGGGGVA